MGDSWQDKCCRVVLAELARRGWELTDGKKLAEAICRDLGDSQRPDAEVKREVVTRYCPILFEACAGRHTPRRERGAQELRRYLRGVASFKTRDANLAEDWTHEAFAKVWKSLAQCDDPSSFLGFADLILVNVIRDYFRKTYAAEKGSGESGYFRKETTFTEMQRDDSELTEIGSSESDPDKMKWPDLFAKKEGEAWYPILKGCIKKILHRAVIIELFFDHKGYKQIAEDLGISVGNVHVCRQRGLDSLRDCDDFWRFYEERLA